jgi:hypothetical protein
VNAAIANGLTCFARDDLDPSVDRLLAGVYPSSWIACAKGPAFLGDIAGDPRWHALDGSAEAAWADDRVALRPGLG